MPINFPNSPTPNELYSYDGKTWEWNGIYWEVYSALTSYVTSTTFNSYTGVTQPLIYRSITGGTYSSGTLYLYNNTGGTITITGFSTSSSGGTVSGDYLPLSGGTVTGQTQFTAGLTANTISATTYQNLPVSGVSSLGTGFTIFDSITNGNIGINSITGDSTNKISTTLNSNTIEIGINEQNLTLWDLVVQGNKLLNGSVSYVSGLTFSVSPLEYLINGFIYSITNETFVTLSSGDSTYDRIDVIYADISGNTGVLQGVPSENPEKAIVDGDTQVEVTFVLVRANSTTADIQSFVIYNENSGPPTEWTFGSGGVQPTRIIGNFTGVTYSGGTSIRVSGVTGAYTTFFRLTGLTELNTNNYSTLQFAVRNLSANTTTSAIRFRFLTTGGTQNGSVVTMNGAGTANTVKYSPTNVSTWQLISIPIWRFYLTNTNVQVLEVAFSPAGTGAQSRYYFDLFEFIEGTSAAPPSNSWTTIRADSTTTTITAPSPNATLILSGGTNIGASISGTSTVVFNLDNNINLGGVSATTISATTYLNLPAQVNNLGIIYGDGFDGTIILNGTNSYSSFTTYASATTTYTLTRSIYPDSLTISSGITLNTNGYMVTCKGNMTISGTCGSLGNSGGNAVNRFNNYSTAGTGATSLKNNNNITDQILVPPNIAGGNGNNAVPGGWGSAGGSISITTFSYGGLGGGGGRGYTGAPAPGLNSTVSFGSGGKFLPYSSFNPSTSNQLGLIGGAITAGVFVASPGGGGGAGGQSGGGWGGAGGGGGGAPFGVKIISSTLTITSTGLLRSNGGNGGNGCPGSLSNWTHGAGGGGGGGGIVYIVTNNLVYTPNNSIQAKGGTGGIGGFGVGVGAALYSTDGSNGTDGFVHIQNTSTGVSTFFTGQY